jgi:hypothetical protein
MESAEELGNWVPNSLDAWLYSLINASTQNGFESKKDLAALLRQVPPLTSLPNFKVAETFSLALDVLNLLIGLEESQ